jgi:hypothetical protein
MAASSPAAMPPQQGFAVDILGGPWLQIGALWRGQGQ